LTIDLGTVAPSMSAVVTGGSNGIGAAVVDRLTKAGVSVVNLDIVEPTDYNNAAVHVEGSSGDSDALHHAITEAEARADRFLIFVACAGVSRPGDSIDYEVSDWHRIVDVNLSAVFFGSRAAAARMTHGGSIVAIGSVAAHIGFGGRAAYCASKSGLVGMMRSLAVEWAPRGIRVNSVSPGYTATELVSRNVESGALNQTELLGRIPAGRLGTPQEMAEAVWFLASPASAYVTGIDILVDGGMAAYGLALAAQA
jgi:NAD(P)-dependent dehydrogenase (short-subunit alcohol dehydrogenase family)